MNTLCSDCVLLLLSGKDFPANYENAVIMKFPYVPPYAEFNLLKKLELRIRKASEYQTPETLVLDVTEWMEHTDEEYFEITAKYCHDHRNFSYVFAAHTERRCAMPMLMVLRAFLPIRVSEERTFADASVLETYLKENYRITPHAASYLAELVMRPDGIPLRSYTVLHTLLNELTENGSRHIGYSTLMSSIRDTDTLLGVLFPDKNEKGEEMYHYEKAI